jgi:hypothetical protein
MNDTLYKLGSFAGKFLLAILVILIIVAFALGGMILGAFSKFERSYARPVLEKIEEAAYFTCLDNQAENTDFISINCPAELSSNWMTNHFLAGFPSTDSLLTNVSAIFETISQLDLPEIPQLSTLPNVQDLLDIVDRSNNLPPFGIFSLGDYGAIALEYINYFSNNGKDLLGFLSSNSISEIETFFNTARYAFVASEHGMGYIKILTSIKVPVKAIMLSALKGLMAGILLIMVILFGMYKLVFLTQKRLKEDQK